MDKQLTHKELISILDYDHLTGYLTWKIRPSFNVKIGDIARSKNSDGYIIIGINGKLYYAHRLACFHYYGYMPENDIDHVDRSKHHNWILNLQESSRSCNMRNIGNLKNNTSGVKGVYLDKAKDRWVAGVKVNQKYKFLGVYKDFDDAVCTRLAGEQCVGWSGCDSCSPAYKYVKTNIL